MSAPKYGLCGDGVYVADELWRMTQIRAAANRERFFKTIILLIEVTQHGSVQRSKVKPHVRQREEASRAF